MCLSLEGGEEEEEGEESGGRGRGRGGEVMLLW